VVVDELGPVVRVDADDRKRKHPHHVLQRFEHPLLCFVSHGTVHRPPGRNVRDRQGETVFTRRVATLMTDQIDLHKPGDGVVPLGPGADRNLRLQQCSRFGMGPPPRHHSRPLRREPAVDLEHVTYYSPDGDQSNYKKGRWTVQEVAGLRDAFNRSIPLEKILEVVDRSPLAIIWQLTSLGLLTNEDLASILSRKYESTAPDGWGT